MSGAAEPMEATKVPTFRERLARSLRGFGPVGWLAVLVIAAGAMVVVPLGALLIVLWAWLSRTPWCELGYLRPRSWAKGLALGIAAGVAFKLLMKAVVMPLLGADPVNHAYHYMAGNRSALAAFAVYAILGAGWGEETFFRGYLFERLGKLLGASPAARGTIVTLTAAIFGSLHYVQGWPGVVQALIVGLVFGGVFAVTGRLYTLMVTHAAFDLAAAAMIYFDAESRIAHLLFT